MDLVLRLKWVIFNSIYDDEVFHRLFIEGWNGWNYFDCNGNETVIKRAADAIISTGLAAAGYKYGMFEVLLSTGHFILCHTIYS